MGGVISETGDALVEVTRLKAQVAQLQLRLLLCPRHHTLAHDDRYQMKNAPGGKVTFTRRT